MDELKDVYMQKLEKVLDIEETIIKNLPKMISSASNEKLIEGLSDHLSETRGHADRLRKILEIDGVSGGAARDDAFRLMVENAGKEISEIEDKDVRDAVIIASAQSIEHLEIAKYGTLIKWAQQLEEDSACVSMLKDTLKEEEAADKNLSSVAEGGLFTTGVNAKAADKVS